MSPHPPAARALAAYLGGRRPAPNAAPPTHLELAAELAPRFLKPDVDTRVEAEALRAVADSPPGAVAETLAARGLLPPELEAPRAFDLAWPPPGYAPLRNARRGPRLLLPDAPPWWWDSDEVAIDPESSLPFLVARWGAVSAALLLLDVAAERLAPWGWRPRRHRVVVGREYDVARHLHAAPACPTEPLLDVLAIARPEWPSGDGLSGGEQAFAPAHNAQVRLLLAMHAFWQAAASPTPERKAAETPDPFAPLVDVLRFGLGVIPVELDGPQLVLLVPRYDDR